MVKTITISDETWQKIARAKIDMFAKDYTEVIERLFEVAEQIKKADSKNEIPKK